MIFLLTLIVSVALIYLVTVVRERLRFLRHVDRIPGPKGLPLIGCALEFKHTNEMLHQLHGYMKEYGNVVRVQVGQTHLVFVADPALLEKLMSSTRVLDKTPDYMFLRNWLGTGLLLSTGAKWQKRRKILTPTFHFHVLEQFVEAFDRNANLLIRKLDAAVGRESVDIQPYVNFYTMDVICETAMGTSMNVQLEGHSSDYVRAANEMGRILVVRTMSAYKRYDLFYRFTADCRAERRACDVLHAMTESVIKRKRSALSRRKKGAATNNNSDAGRDEFGIKTKVAFLDLLLQCTVDGKKLTDEEIREEVDTFMYAGQDTVSIAISFALLCLAQNPAAQSKAYAELYSIFGKDKHRAATHKELLEMKYLELAIKETLRLYPSVPIYGRHLTTDYEWGTLSQTKASRRQQIPTSCRRPSLSNRADGAVLRVRVAPRSETARRSGPLPAGTVRRQSSREARFHLSAVQRRTEELYRSKVRDARNEVGPLQDTAQLRAAAGRRLRAATAAGDGAQVGERDLRAIAETLTIAIAVLFQYLRFIRLT